MAEDSLVIYYFDGSDGCDVCNALTGYTFDPDIRPHPDCDCVVECIDMATHGTCQLELRDLAWDESEDEVVEDDINSWGCIPSETVFSAEQGTFEVSSLSTELDGAAREAGWLPPATGPIAIGYTIPSRTSYYTIEYTLSWYYATVQGTWYQVCDVDGNVAEIELYTEYGDYSAIYDYEYEITNVADCDFG